MGASATNPQAKHQQAHEKVTNPPALDELTLGKLLPIVRNGSEEYHSCMAEGIPLPDIRGRFRPDHAFCFS